VRAGCRSFNLLPGDADGRMTVEGALAVRSLLQEAVSAPAL